MALLQRKSTIDLLRVHRRGTGFGPAGDRIDGELVVRLERFPSEAYGITLRDDADGPTHRAMFDLLRAAFEAGREVELEVELEPGRSNGAIMRVTVEPSSAPPPRPVVTDPFGGLVVMPVTPG